MQRSKKLHFRSSLRKLKCIREDCKEVLELANTFDKEFRVVWEDVVSRIKDPKKTDGYASLVEEVRRRNQESPPEVNVEMPEEREIQQKEQPPDHEKAIFRKIAQQTHPDRHQHVGVDTEEEKTLREKMFRDAQSAYDEGNIEQLLSICADLDIDLEDINIPYDDVIKKIENVSEIEYNKMSSITGSIAWMWGHADKDDVVTRTTLIKTMIARFGYYDVSDELILQTLIDHKYVEEKNEAKD